MVAPYPNIKFTGVAALREPGHVEDQAYTNTHTQPEKHNTMGSRIVLVVLRWAKGEGNILAKPSM